MLPSVLKNMNLFNEGQSYLGVVEEVTRPDLERIMEPWRGGGLNGPVDLDMGQSTPVMTWKPGGLVAQPLRQYGVTRINGVMLRFAGAYQNDETGQVDALEITVRGRHKKIGLGSAKAGEKDSMEVETTCTFYQLVINGEEIVYIDLLNAIERVNGVDLLAEQRAAIGA